MTRIEYTTKATLKAGIRKAKIVYITPRFGCSEHSVQISKKEALWLADTIDSATPHDLEMSCGYFGHTDEFGNLYLG